MEGEFNSNLNIMKIIGIYIFLYFIVYIYPNERSYVIIKV